MSKVKHKKIFRSIGIFVLFLTIWLVYPGNNAEGKASTLYYVQFGIYNTLKEALSLFNSLNERGEGVAIYVVESEKGRSLYAVVSGTFTTKDDAIKAKEIYTKKYPSIRGITISASSIFDSDPIVTSNIPVETQSHDQVQEIIEDQHNVKQTTNSYSTDSSCTIAIKSPLSKSVLLGTTTAYFEATITNCRTPQVIITIDGVNIYDLNRDTQIKYNQQGETWIITGMIPFKKEKERHVIELQVQRKTSISKGSVVFYNN